MVLITKNKSEHSSFLLMQRNRVRLLLLKLFSDEFEFFKFFRQVCQNVFKTLFRVFFVIFCHKVCYLRDALCAVPYSDIKLFFIAENRVYAVAEIGVIAARPGVFSSK